MTRHGLSGVLLAALLSSPGLADDALWCAMERKQLQTALESLERYEKLVPYVPPDEAAYLKREKEASISANSAPRFNALTTRPSYYPYQLHMAFDTAKENLEDIEKLPLDSSIERRIEVTAKAPSSLCAAKAAWDDYVRMDGGTNLHSQQVTAAAFWLAIAISAPGQYISCLAQRLELDEALAGARR